MNIAYVRVSTVEQNEARQIEALKEYDIDENGWYIEKISGKNTNRPKLQEMLDKANEGDTIYIHDFSRLARSTKDLLEIVETLNKKGVRLISNKEKIDTNSATGKMLLTVIGAIAEFERQNLLERQREGIEIAKKNGVYKGRKPMTVDKDLWDYNYYRYQQEKINKSQFAKIMKISRPTLDKLLKEVV